MEQETYYTIRQLAEHIKRSKNSVWRWINEGKLKSNRFGAQHRISEADWQTAKAAFNLRSVSSTATQI